MAPTGLLKPVVTVATDQGRMGPGVTMETEPWFAVQILDPSKVIPVGSDPTSLATVVTGPSGWLGSIVYRTPGKSALVTKILPRAAMMPVGRVAPVQVSRCLPSLARTREIVPSP